MTKKEVKKEVVNLSEKEVGIAISDGKELGREQIDLIKQTIAKGASDNELSMFLNVCKATNLNPFLRQVHLVPRWDSKIGAEVRTVQVGIDGFRAIAEEGGFYAGSDDALFRDEKEINTGGKYPKNIKVPGSATVAVWKLMPNGQRYAFTSTARWDEFYPGEKQGYMWHKMPFNQLAKCAEASALRKAFPKLLSGMYAPEEMQQASVENVEVVNAGEIGKVVNDNNELFLKAKNIIEKLNSPEDVESLREKINKSDKYNEAQKKELINTVDVRLTSLLQADAENYQNN